MKMTDCLRCFCQMGLVIVFFTLCFISNIFNAINEGNIYYPNGQLAVLLCDTGSYQNFLVFNNQTQMAMFDSNGNGYCNYLNGNIR